jgi:hypothetical protein
MNRDRLIGILKRGKNSLIVLRIVSKSDIPLSSNEIAIKTGKNISSVIKILNELEKNDGVTETSELQRGRMYKISQIGLDVLQLLED